MQLNRQAAVPSFTGSCPRKSVVCRPQYRATLGASASASASARRTTERTVCSALTASESYGASGVPPKDPPRQGKPTGGAGDPQGRGPAPGVLQAAIHAALAAQPILGALLAVGAFLGGTAAFIAAVCALLGLHASLATKTDVTEAKNEVLNSLTISEGRTKERVESVQKSVDELVESVDELVESVDELVESVQKSVDELVESVQKSVDELVESVQKSVDELKKSVDSLKPFVIGQGFVCAFVAGLCIAVLVAGKGKGSN